VGGKNEEAEFRRIKLPTAGLDALPSVRISGHPVTSRTNHTVLVVAPLDQMFMLWSAMNRLSSSGEVLGPVVVETIIEGKTIYMAK